MAEKEYIEREALKKQLQQSFCKDCENPNRENPNREHCTLCWVEEVLEVLQTIPAADVRPVVRGRWIRHYEQADTGEDIITYPCGWVCSECGRWESEDEPFCNCGADMEES